MTNSLVEDLLCWLLSKWNTFGSRAGYILCVLGLKMECVSLKYDFQVLKSLCMNVLHSHAEGLPGRDGWAKDGGTHVAIRVLSAWFKRSHTDIFLSMFMSFLKMTCTQLFLFLTIFFLYSVIFFRNYLFPLFFFFAILRCLGIKNKIFISFFMLTNALRSLRVFKSVNCGIRPPGY